MVPDARRQPKAHGASKSLPAVFIPNPLPRKRLLPMSQVAQSSDSMESFAALFEESLTRQEMRAGEVITAEVMRVDQNFVVVNAGLKSESYISIDEFRTDREIGRAHV